MTIRLSRRIQELNESATLAVASRAQALRKQGVNVVAFGTGEPDFDTPPHVKDAAIAALRAGDTKYPAPVSGKDGLRQAIRDYLHKYCALNYSPTQICATVGAKDALYLAFASLLDPGDEVILGVPYWVSYPEQIRFVGATPVLINSAVPRGGKITADELKHAITPRTRVVVLNSPSNPSGAVYTRTELESLAGVLRTTEILVISDEIYARLVYGPEPYTSFASLPGMHERTITVNGASKSFAMTGWRLGFAAGPQRIIEAMVRLQGQTTSGPTSFVQTAAIAAFGEHPEFVDQMRSTYRERGHRMWQTLTRMPGVTCAEPEGAFFCFPDVSGTFAHLGVTNADQFAEVVIERAHVALVSGTAFGCPTHVRLSFATSAEQIADGLARLGRLLAK